VPGRVDLDHAAIAALMVGDEVRDEVERRVDRGADRARQLVDVETGRLRDSIGSEVRRVGLEIVGVVGSDLEYSLVEEIRDPYLRPAIDAAK
jgi:hypothetical protein